MNQTSNVKKSNSNAGGALAEVFSLAEAKQGDGLSNVSTKDVMIPRIKLLQKMSPECDNASLPEAKAGQIFNSASQNVYDGPTGIRVVPCEYIRTYVEWAPEGTGNKAPVNIHPATSDIMSKAKKSPTDNRFYLDNGNYVEETANHIVLILDEKNNVESRGILTMKSSQLKYCLKLCKNTYETEYSGNATLNNIKQISKTGVNRISVGEITHSTRSFDTTLLLR